MARIGTIVAAISLVLGLTGAALADRDGDNLSWPEDCNDGNSAVFPGAAEVCDGFDNACTGDPDAGCFRDCPGPRATLEFVFADAAGTSAAPRTARSDDGFDVVWVDERDGNREIYLARFDDSGSLLEERRVTDDAAPSTAPAIASPGDWRAVVWVDERDNRKEIYFSRLTDSGLFDTGDVRITARSADDVEPSLSWAGDGWGLAYAEGRNSFKVWVTKLTDVGGVSNQRTDVSGNGGNGRMPSLAFSGSGHGVAWQDDRHGDNEIYFRALDLDMNPIGAGVRVSNAAGDSSRPSLVWAGDRFGVAWQDERDGNREIYAALLDPAGNPLAPELRVTADAASSDLPRLVYTGTEFLVSWIDAPTGVPEIRVARIDRDGNLLEPDGGVGGPAPGFAHADITWNGEAPVFVWEDAASGELRGALASCCGDGDGDGSGRCDGDCDDGRASIGPGNAELCNGIDDDCDGDVDLGCMRTCGGPDRVAAPLRHESGAQTWIGGTDLDWDGQTLGAAWDQDPSSGFGSEIVFQPLAADGTPAGPPVTIASGTGEDYNEPAIAAKPGGWGLVHQGRSPSTVYVRALDAAGNPVGQPTRWFTNDLYMDNPQIVWDGRGFALVYERNNTNGSGASSGSVFARVSAAGLRIGGLTGFGYQSEDPSIAWNGSEYAVVVTGSSSQTDGIWRYRFDREGRRIGSESNVTNWTGGADADPYIVWSGNGYGLVFLGNSSQILFRTLDAEGLPLGSIRRVDGGNLQDYLSSPVVAWNGEEYYVQWINEDQRKIFARRIDANGSALGAPFEVANSDDGFVDFYWRHDLVATGEAFVSSFRRSGGSAPGMVTRVFGCCAAGDPDGDGSCLDDCAEGDATIYPGAPEICDGLDNDCDQTLPQDEVTDDDQDGVFLCADCDDTDPERYPGAPERCNLIDDDCDGFTNEEGPFFVVEDLWFEADKERMYWASGSGSRHDTQRGLLEVLRDSGGDFTAATDACIKFNAGGTNASDASVPDPGKGFVYYVAAGSTLCPGTYESGGAGQVESRDAEILASPEVCP